MNKKRTFLSSILAISLAVVLLVLPVSAAAARDEAESEATFTLTAGDDSVEPAEPGDGVITEHSGPLSLDYVPNFRFGEKTLSSETEIYPDESLRPNVQVSDRRGTGEGWTLSLKATPFQNTEKTRTLKGAVLRIKGIEIFNPNESQSEAPGVVSIGTGLEFGEGIGDGVSHTLMTAAIDKGQGTWLGKFYTVDSEDAITNLVELEVPAGNYAGSYKSVLTWTLEATP